MSTYYVDGVNGNDSYDGTSPTFVSGTTGPKKTLTGAEAIVAAGDTVWVKAGTYRELWNMTNSGSSGSPIEFKGDYLGTKWPGSGGVVRLTGSDDDKVATRANLITANAKSFRTITGFAFDSSSGTGISLTASCNNFTIQQCSFQQIGGTVLNISGTGNNMVVQNCVFYATTPASIVLFTNTATATVTGCFVQNCIFVGGTNGVATTRIDGFTVRNCTFTCRVSTGVNISTALAVGKSITVNNCIFMGVTTGVSATALGEIVEDYNDFFANTTDRTNTSTGAHSTAYPALFDVRWLFQVLNAGAGPNSVAQLITPFDLGSQSQIINVAGTSPTTTDMRGTAIQGAAREWGALEYDSTLKFKGARKGGAIFRR